MKNFTAINDGKLNITNLTLLRIVTKQKPVAVPNMAIAIVTHALDLSSSYGQRNRNRGCQNFYYQTKFVKYRVEKTRCLSKPR